MEAFLEKYDPMWVDLLSIVIPVFLAFLIGFFFASIAENMRNKHLKKKLAAKTNDFERTESELKEILKQYNILKNKSPEKVEIVKEVYKKDESQTLAFKSLQKEYEKYKSANVTLMEDNLAKEKEILKLKDTSQSANNLSLNTQTYKPEIKTETNKVEAVNPIKNSTISSVRKVDIIYELNKILGESRKSAKSDLTKITSISGTLEIKLNSFGIYTYKQIANIDDKASSLIEELTGLSKEKIKEYKWIEQAKNLI